MAGFDVTVVSPAGGHAPLDPNSVELFKGDASSVAFLGTTRGALGEDPEALRLPRQGRRVRCHLLPRRPRPRSRDLAVDAQSHQLINEFWAKGKIVSAVCHGPAAFVNVKLPSGEHLLQGRTVTGFTNAEEEQVKLAQYMPFMLETELDKASGGKFVKADALWAEKVVADGKLITGQNPASAKGIGAAIVQAVNA